jgi:hypothetical protein
MIKFIVALLLLFCLECHANEFKPNEEVISVAKQYLYVREKSNNNDAPEIDQWLKNCGLGSGYSYCNAYAVSMYKKTYEKHGLKSPYPMYAGVARLDEYCLKNTLKFKVISSKQVLFGIETPLMGDLVSWKHGKAQITGFGYKGHRAINKYYINPETVYTIEANTKAGAGGDQSGTVLGDMKYGKEGVYERVRSINIYSNFPIVFFIRSR